MTDNERQEQADEQFAPAPYFEDDSEAGMKDSVAYNEDAEDNLSPAVRALMASCVFLSLALSVSHADSFAHRISGKSKSRIDQEEEPDVHKVSLPGLRRCVLF